MSTYISLDTFENHKVINAIMIPVDKPKDWLWLDGRACDLIPTIRHNLSNTPNYKDILGTILKQSLKYPSYEWGFRYD